MGSWFSKPKNDIITDPNECESNEEDDEYDDYPLSCPSGQRTERALGESEEESDDEEEELQPCPEPLVMRRFIQRPKPPHMSPSSPASSPGIEEEGDVDDDVDIDLDSIYTKTPSPSEPSFPSRSFSARSPRQTRAYHVQQPNHRERKSLGQY